MARDEAASAAGLATTTKDDLTKTKRKADANAETKKDPKKD